MGNIEPLASTVLLLLGSAALIDVGRKYGPEARKGSHCMHSVQPALARKDNVLLGSYLRGWVVGVA